MRSDGLAHCRTTAPTRYKDHPLKGDPNGNREAHIEPDWLLIYRIEGREV